MDKLGYETNPVKESDDRHVFVRGYSFCHRLSMIGVEFIDTQSMTISFRTTLNAGEIWKS